MIRPAEKDTIVEGQLVHSYWVEPTSTPKKTLLFLHGWGAQSSLWFASTQVLAEKGYTLVYLDLPGFGKSESPKHPFHLDDYAHIVSAFIAKHELDSPILIGHSFGGKTAVRIASRLAKSLSGMVLVNSSGLPHTTWATKTKITLAHTVKPILRLPFMQGIAHQLLRISGSDDYVATPELRETFVNIVSEHIVSDLEHISVPTLIVWGEKDDNTYTPVNDAHYLNAHISQSEVHIIKQAGHYCFLDAQFEFGETVLAFLEKHYGKN